MKWPRLGRGIAGYRLPCPMASRGVRCSNQARNRAPVAQWIERLTSDYRGLSAVPPRVVRPANHAKLSAVRTPPTFEADAGVGPPAYR